MWKERFEIRVYSDSSSILEISVYDYEEFGFSDNFIGRLVHVFTWIITGPSNGLLNYDQYLRNEVEIFDFRTFP